MGFGQDLFAANHLTQEHPALNQGRLGSLFDTYKKLCHWYEEEQRNLSRDSSKIYADKRGFNHISLNNHYKPTMN